MLGNKRLLNNYLDTNPHVSGWFNDVWDVVVKIFLKRNDNTYQAKDAL